VGRKLDLISVLMYTVTIIMSVFSLFPLYWMFRSSFMTSEQIFAVPMIWVPDKISLDNFREAINAIPFLKYLLNTMLIVTLNVVGNVVSSSMGGFGFARMRFPGRNIIFSMVLATMMIPSTVLLIPQFFGYTKLGLYDTFVPLIAPAFFMNAFFIFMFRQFFQTLPLDYDEAAFIDGASYPRIYSRIVMPMCKPVIATVCVFSFMGSWNDFFGPLIYLQSESKYTLALGLLAFRSQFKSEWHYLMAISSLITIPMIIMYFFAQRQFIQGISFSGLKG